MEFYSQHKQDEYVFNNFFKDKKNGVFIDIGATNGVGINNTFFFEKNFDWTGICIEPQEYYFKDLIKNRKAHCINGCIADFDGEGLFLEIDGYPKALSGLIDKYDKRHLERIEYEIQSFGGSKKEISVNCYTLNKLLEINNFKKVDLCSLDIEGGELDVLKTIDFEKFIFDVLIVENNYKDSSIKKFLKEKSFQLIEVLECDEIYKKI